MEKKAYKIIEGHFLPLKDAPWSLSLSGLLEKVPWVFWHKVLNRYLLSTGCLHSAESWRWDTRWVSEFPVLMDFIMCWKVIDVQAESICVQGLWWRCALVTPEGNSLGLGGEWWKHSNSFLEEIMSVLSIEGEIGIGCKLGWQGRVFQVERWALWCYRGKRTWCVGNCKCKLWVDKWWEIRMVWYPFSVLVIDKALQGGEWLHDERWVGELGELQWQDVLSGQFNQGSFICACIPASSFQLQLLALQSHFLTILSFTSWAKIWKEPKEWSKLKCLHNFSVSSPV